MINRTVSFERLERWKNRPLFKGLPIPFTTLIDGNGIPNFQAIDSEKVFACIRDRLCGICGEPIDDPGWVAFIGGERCLEDLVFSDPGMHPECAYFSAETCPYLKNADGAYSKKVNLKAPANTKMAVLGDADKRIGRPKRMMIYFCRTYEPVRMGNLLHVRAAKHPRRIDWTAMPESE